MLDEQLQNLLQDIARTVAGDLRTIFARVRVRGAKQADKNLVDDFLSIVYLPKSVYKVCNPPVFYRILPG